MTPAPRSEQELDDTLSAPRDATVRALAGLDGDIVILGAGGKMGPTLARMAQRAVDGTGRQVIAVSRFSSKTALKSLYDHGVHAVQCDLLDRKAMRDVPEAPNVVFMAGQKFGTQDAPSRTWMMNVVLPAICAERFADARFVVFSTGNVYPLTSVASGGASETTGVAPIGEYAQSCVGRERVFEHYAATRGTKVAIMRLNYAIDLRYGVLTDLAVKVMNGAPISLTMGHVNVIWQRDANCAALELLALATAPPLVVNVAGATTLSVRELAAALGQRLGRTPVFEGHESPDALLSDAARMRSLLPAFDTPLDSMLDWVAEWVREGRPLLGKPTHFEARDGSF